MGGGGVSMAFDIYDFLIVSNCLSRSLYHFSLSIYLSISILSAGSEHRFLAVGIDFRRREIALLAAALGPLAFLAAALGPLAWLT